MTEKLIQWGVAENFYQAQAIVIGLGLGDGRFEEALARSFAWEYRSLRNHGRSSKEAFSEVRVSIEAQLAAQRERKRQAEAETEGEKHMDSESNIVTGTGEQTSLAMPPGASVMHYADPETLDALDNAEVGMSVDMKYYEFKHEGDSVRCVFNGFRSIVSVRENERAEVPAIVFQTKDGVYLNAGASLVEQFNSVPPGAAVEITYTGKEKTKSGYNVNKFDVRMLKVSVPTREVALSQTSRPATGNDVVTEFWAEVKARRMSQQDGQDHLKLFNGDFAEALQALRDFDQN